MSTKTKQGIKKLHRKFHIKCTTRSFHKTTLFVTFLLCMFEILKLTCLTVSRFGDVSVRLIFEGRTDGSYILHGTGTGKRWVSILHYALYTLHRDRTIVTVRNSSCGKAMVSQACQACQEFGPQGWGLVYTPRQTPSGRHTHTLGRQSPHPPPNIDILWSSDSI